MGARGRKSAVSLAAVTPIGERLLICRPEAPDDVRAVFARIVADVGADHFRASDADLIEQYSAAICLARDAYDQLREEGPVNDGRVNAWQGVLEKANRASVALSGRLRLAPQCRVWTARPQAATQQEGAPMTLSTNDRIRAWCQERNLHFKPWEIHPADVGSGPSPHPVGSGGAVSWPKAQELRRKILAELKAAASGGH